MRFGKPIKSTEFVDIEMDYVDHVAAIRCPEPDHWLLTAEI